MPSKFTPEKSSSDHTLSQDEINALLVERARAGKCVVRLKGGDPYLFGRGGEEAQVLVREGIPFEEVPGVTSAIAAPAYAGIPVTHRDFASMVTFVTGHEDPNKADSAIDWRNLAQLKGTKVFLMGVERLRSIAARLVEHGAAKNTPVALVRWGTTARQESLEGTLADIADLAEARDFRAPAVIVVGDVVKLRTELNWFEKLPLFGRRVVVTRTREQASALSLRLAQLGADVLEIPTIRIVPIPLGEPERKKMETLSQLYDWLVFTSPNGAQRFFDEFLKIHQNDIRALGNIRIAAVGPATGSSVRRYWVTPELQPAIFTVEKLTEALAAHTPIAGSRFCLPHGRLADPLLANRLRELGGEVDQWLVYDTQPEQADVTGARERFLREGAHCITFTSSSTAENWHALNLEPAPGKPRPRPISMGPVTSATLRRLGYENVIEAPEARINSLIETIRQISIE